MIPNPRKVVTIDFAVDELKRAALLIPGYFGNKYQLVESNEVFNQYTYGATEFLSAGVYMDLNLAAVGDGRTEVSIEVRRKIGSFDQAFEVQHANNHIANFVNALTALLLNARDPENHPIVQGGANLPAPKAAEKLAWYWRVLQILLLAFFAMCLYYYWKSKQ